MIPSCAIGDPTPYAPGWLGEYCAVLGDDVAPWSFHLLSAFFVLSSYVGRRARLDRAAGTLYPPTSVLLLGPSGTGKGLALAKAMRVLRAASSDLPGFYLGEGGFTIRGVTQEWQRLQRSTPGVLEGAHIEDEIANVLTERTGTETIITWLIRALAQQDLVDLTGEHGRSVVSGATAAFGFGSTVSYLRRAVSVDAFTGGLMHRFLIAHESEQRDTQERVPDDREVANLVDELRTIRRAAPPALSVSAPAEARLALYRGQAKQRAYDNHHLAGFWNRFPMLVLRIGALYTLATLAVRVEVENLVAAENLLLTKLYPVIGAVVDEVSASHDKKRMLDIAEDLRAAGDEGWVLAALFRKLDALKPATQAEVLMAMQNQELLWRYKDRVFGRKQWAERAKNAETAGDE